MKEAHFLEQVEGQLARLDARPSQVAFDEHLRWLAKLAEKLTLRRFDHGFL